MIFEQIAVGVDRNFAYLIGDELELGSLMFIRSGLSVRGYSVDSPGLIIMGCKNG